MKQSQIIDIDDRMPPAPEDPLTDQQIEMIFTWISQGAQNNSCNSCDTVNIGYLSHILPLIELKCQGCHSGGEPEAGLSLTSYTNISAICIKWKSIFFSYRIKWSHIDALWWKSTFSV